MIVYICNGEEPDCKKTFCLYNGTGLCDHTTDERYALNEEHHFITLEDGTLLEVEQNEKIPD